MCGIVGYIGTKDITSVLLVGLERLSYRGYDSAGIAIMSDGELGYWKQPGKVHHLVETLKPLTIQGTMGIGHTRWATHGEPNESNAHPQVSTNNKIALVHNGIIENYLLLKKKLIQSGHIFRSETDSEVIVHLIEECHVNANLEDAVEKATQQLTGAYSIAVISEQDPNKIIVCKKGSPLIIGIGNNENYISSDVNAIITHTKEVIYLEDDELGIITQDTVSIKKVNGPIIQKPVHTIQWDANTIHKNGFDHYMLKEINEQPTIARNIISKHCKATSINFKHLHLTPTQLSETNRFIIQACGTSWHAGLIGKYLFEKYIRVPTEVDVSSEFRYRHMLTGSNEIVVAISQSGETADTLACIREAKSKFFNILSFVNVKGSSIDRESDGTIYTHSGPEIGVASTKNYIAQLLNIYLFSLYLGHLKQTISPEELDHKLSMLKCLPDQIESILSQTASIKCIAEKYVQSREFIFIGRGLNYPTALEGALKLKEISYIHATGYPAGELKHGPIALIDDKLPVVCLAPQSHTYDKMFANIQEVRARNGRTIIIATEGDTTIQELADDIIYIPECPEEHSPILSVIPLQLLSYFIAVKLNCDVDQPRNLAKSVTVE